MVVYCGTTSKLYVGPTDCFLSCIKEIYSSDADINGPLNEIPHFFKEFPQNIYITHETQKMQSLFIFLSHTICD